MGKIDPEEGSNFLISHVYCRFALGGIEQYILGLSQKQMENGHQVYIVIPRGTFLYPKVPIDTTFNNRMVNREYITQLASFPKRFKEVRKLKPDILHIHSYWLNPFVNAFLMIGNLIAKRLIWTPHYNPSSRMFVIESSKRFINPAYYYHFWLGPTLMRRVDAIIACTEEESRFYEKRHICSARIPYGVDIHTFHPSSRSFFQERLRLKDCKVILCVGRLTPLKGYEYLIRALPTIKQSLKEVKVAIIGEGEDKTRLMKLCNDLMINDDVIFLGYLPHSDLPQAYSSAEVFVLPSIAEPFGIVILEALACGAPVIATNAGGVKWVVTGDTAVLVPPKDEVALAKAILNILTNKKLARNLSIRGRDLVVKKYSLEKIARNVENVYKGF